MYAQNKRLLLIWSAVPFLLLIPLVAMQLTAEVVWTLGDFLAMGLLLLGLGLGVEMVLRTVTKNSPRIGLLLTLVLIFFLIWAELAVGLLGTPFSGS